ncbi:MAG: prepilin-type N-terminal cleavage/methylation domain-containing protein [Candidatus Gracilibacteria bacterium]|nr:prepilin-type N-terminal cleavage/methylation domain-containing protein [Candidatus Gracilibacteria bacterium]
MENIKISFLTKAFTLVELIIVITILAILSTIGFMSYQSYTIDARDGKRKRDISEIRNGLEIYETKNSILPEPDEKVIYVISGSLNQTIALQGFLGKEVQKLLRTTGEIKDAKDNFYYTYTTDSNRKKYELLTYLENNLTYNNNLNQVYAGFDYSLRNPYVLGNYVVFFSGITNNPLQESILTSTGKLDLTTTNGLYKIISTGSGITTATGTELGKIIETITKTTISPGGNTSINAICGTANGTTIASIPTTNLCGDGTIPTVSGTGPWTWICLGSGNPIGTNANCSANKILSVGSIVAQSGSETALYAGIYTGGHGKTIWVANNTDISLQWKLTRTSTTNASSVTDGRLNTGTFNTNHPASNYCQNLVRAGYSDWYLPASDANVVGTISDCGSKSGELQFLYCQHKGNGSQSLLGFSEIPYWASTEDGANVARQLYFQSGNRTSSRKDASYYFRCIRVAD